MLGDTLRTLPQYLIPHHALSRLIYWLMRRRWPFFKNAFIAWFVKQYQVDMSQAKNPDIESYPDFNHFFTRELRADARPIAKAPGAIVSPVDGRISEVGLINDDTIIQAKNHSYSMQSLLGGDTQLASRFNNGSFINIYLSPRDYHRIHMPLTGELQSMIYVPGRLFSVSPSAVRSVPGLFARNERVISIFDSEIGSFAMVKVGALFVSSIDTVWHGAVTPRRPKTLEKWDYATGSRPKFERGEEVARFNMGSTVILLFEPGKLSWPTDLAPHQPMNLGELIAIAL
ncbi:MAG: phosphatidylserine decarboxylase [Gammaproteobacteria bacterium]|nr:phosphatidylserine decarboxylase [Gammaproteobacteria bacterium]